MPQIKIFSKLISVDHEGLNDLQQQVDAFLQGVDGKVIGVEWLQSGGGSASIYRLTAVVTYREPYIPGWIGY